MSIDELLGPPVGLREKIRRFFHTEETPYGMAAVRILLPLALLGASIPRWGWAREIYSNDGAPAPLWIGYGFQNMLPIVPGTVAVALSTLMIFSLIALSLGWCSRLNAVLSCGLYFYINIVDSISTMTKYSVIATHALLFLSLCPCGAVWSIDSWLKGGRRKTGPLWPGETRLVQPKFPAWPRRLLQLHLSLVYFGAAITKIHTPAFFTGEQMQTWMMTQLNFSHPVGEFLSMFPALLVIAAYIAIIWEVVFLFACWKGWSRICSLLLGAAFHIGTYYLLGLVIFPAICISIYFAWLDERDVAIISRFLRKVRRKLADSRMLAVGRSLRDRLANVIRPRPSVVPSAVVFTAVAAVIVFAGIELEYRLDRYGHRRPEGPYELVKLPREYAEKRIYGPKTVVKDFDQFVDIQLGTFKIAGIIALPRTEFKAGETFTVQCGLSHPRADMWADCQILDPEGRTIELIGYNVLRESNRAEYQFKMPNYVEPGEYSIVVRKAGNEVLRRKFKIVGPSLEERRLAN